MVEPSPPSYVHYGHQLPWTDEKMVTYDTTKHPLMGKMWLPDTAHPPQMHGQHGVEGDMCHHANVGALHVDVPPANW